MKIFFSYIRYRLSSVVTLLAVVLTFYLIFSVYDIPSEPILYGTVISSVILAFSAVFDFLRFRSRHILLSHIKLSADIDISELPDGANLIEKDLSEIISVVFARKQKEQFERARTVREMTDYYTMWVHQIKTPISAMRLLLQSGEYSGEEIEEQLFSIEEYVGMVLNYIRCEDHMSDYVIKRMKLDVIIRQAVKKYRKAFIKKGISLEYETVPSYVIGDEKWLTFVCEQVLSNSLKYTEKGKISVYLADERGTVLCIEDSGIGIEAEDLPRVFERGYTGYNGRADRKSTGIGLYLCSQIMERMGFKMRIESRVGKGTRVYLDFGDTSSEREIYSTE